MRCDGSLPLIAASSLRQIQDLAKGNLRRMGIKRKICRITLAAMKACEQNGSSAGYSEVRAFPVCLPSFLWGAAGARYRAAAFFLSFSCSRSLFACFLSFSFSRSLFAFFLSFSFSGSFLRALILSVYSPVAFLLHFFVSLLIFFLPGGGPTFGACCRHVLGQTIGTALH